MKIYLLLLLVSFQFAHISSKTLRTPSAVPEGFSLTGKNLESGRYISAAGDVNGDGYTDIIASLLNVETGYIPGAKNIHEAFVLYGGPTASLKDTTFTDITPEKGFKINFREEQILRNIKSADLNGDGNFEIILSFNTKDTVQRIYVIFGGKNLKEVDINNMSETQGFVITFEKFEDYDNISFNVVGDINGDGYSDLACVDRYYLSEEDKENGQDSEGAIFVIYGGKSLTSFDVRTMSPSQGAIIKNDGKNKLENFYQIVQIGDINNDGVADLALKVDFFENNHGYYKAVLVLYGGKNLASVKPSKLTPKQGFMIVGRKEEGFAAKYAGAGDVNKDGYADILLEDNHGVVYLIFGAENMAAVNITTMTAAQGITITNQAKLERGTFGKSLACAGDVNNDGYADVTISSFELPLGEKRGKEVAYVVYGGPSLTSFAVNEMKPAQGFSFSTIQEQRLVNSTVHSAGDVNKDGYGDLLVSVTGLEGAVHVLFGGPSPK